MDFLYLLKACHLVDKKGRHQVFTLIFSVYKQNFLVLFHLIQKTDSRKNFSNKMAPSSNNNDAFDSSFFEKKSRFDFMKQAAIAAGAVEVDITIDQKTEMYHPFTSYSVARPQQIYAPESVTQDEKFSRLKKDRTFCLVNSEDNYDKKNPLEMEFYNTMLDKIMKKRQLKVWLTTPRDKKIYPSAVKKPKLDNDYTKKYDTDGFFPFKYCE